MKMKFVSKRGFSALRIVCFSDFRECQPPFWNPQILSLAFSLPPTPLQSPATGKSCPKILQEPYKCNLTWKKNYLGKCGVKVHVNAFWKSQKPHFYLRDLHVIRDPKGRKRNLPLVSQFELSSTYFKFADTYTYMWDEMKDSATTQHTNRKRNHEQQENLVKWLIHKWNDKSSQ